jgi:hypothetical protein
VNDQAQTAVTQTDEGFAFGGAGDGSRPKVAPANADGPLGLLFTLPGTWKGRGFNTIWRPHHGDNQDRFLELNLTSETLVFTHINGLIPNRGLLMPDIEMAGVTYMQQIADATTNVGLHIEPGIWLNVPRTTNPSEAPTVVRMATIPHGTSILAQGAAQLIAAPGHPAIPKVSIIPFPIGTPPPGDSAGDFTSGKQEFPELDLNKATVFRSRPATGVDEAMLENPNVVLERRLTGQTITGRTFIHISTTHSPIRGGGTANTAFLADAANPPGGNARTAEVDAKFWIETLADNSLQLQYSQLVQLDFNGLRWPHVTVATLEKQP